MLSESDRAAKIVRLFCKLVDDWDSDWAEEEDEEDDEEQDEEEDDEDVREGAVLAAVLDPTEEDGRTGVVLAACPEDPPTPDPELELSLLANI